MENHAKCLIIIPAYNEAESIAKVVNDLTDHYPQYDYVVVNDGSQDATKEICLKNHFHVLNLPVNMGIGGAVQTGYCYARDNGYDMAVQIDGDGQHDVTFLNGMIDLIESGQADVVIGSRFVRREGFQSSRLRRLGTAEAPGSRGRRGVGYPFKNGASIQGYALDSSVFR